MNITVMFDGGCSMGKGIAAGAAVAFDEYGNELGYRAKFLTGVTTPVAEYTGLIVGLGLAHALGGTHVSAWGDAELIVRHVDGRYACRKAHLQPYLVYVRGLMAQFEECVVRELPKAGPKNKRRYANTRADALATACMDARADLG